MGKKPLLIKDMLSWNQNFNQIFNKIAHEAKLFVNGKAFLGKNKVSCFYFWVEVRSFGSYGSSEKGPKIDEIH